MTRKKNPHTGTKRKAEARDGGTVKAFSTGFRRFGCTLWPGDMLPLLVLASVPTLLYRLAVLPVNGESAAFLYVLHDYDILAWWKAVFVFGVALWMLAHACARFLGGWRPRQKRTGMLLFAAAGTTLLSTFLSRSPRTAWLGFSGQYEGAVIILAYLIAIWYAAEFAVTVARRFLLLRCIGGVVCLAAVVGIGQGFGLDLWRSDVGRWLAGMEGMAFRYNFVDTNMAYGTSFQPNHFGMLMAMAGVLGVGMLFAEVSRRWRCLWIVVIVLSVIAAVLSQSRAALGVLALVGGGLLFYLWMQRSRDMDLPGVPAGGAGKWYRRLWPALSVLFFLLVLAYVPQVRNSVMTQWKRSMAERRISAGGYSLRSLELHGDRILFGLENGIVSVGKNPRGSWNADMTAGGATRALSLRLEEGKGGWTRILVQPLLEIPGGDLSFHDDGRIRFRSEEGELDFFHAGRKIFAVDFEDRLLEEMRTPRSLPIAGFERLMSGRGYLWSRALALVPDHPWLGTGPGTFALVFPNDGLLDMQRYYYRTSEDKAHGVWLALMVQLGLVGFAIFMALYAVIVYKGLVAQQAPTTAALAGVVAYGLSAFTNDSTVGVTPIFCLLCGLCISASVDDGAGPPSVIVPDT